MTQQPPGQFPPQYQQPYQQQYPPQYQQPPFQQQPPAQQQQPGYQQGYEQQPGYQQQPGYPPNVPAPVPPQGAARQDVPRIAPSWSPYPVLVVTLNDLPGYRIEHVFGHAYGVTVRTGAFGANLGAGFKALGGGEVVEFTRMITEWRHVAVMRMAEMAQQMGANAVLAMRFECEDVSQMAYGTAVLATPLSEPDDSDGTEDEVEEEPAVE